MSSLVTIFILGFLIFIHELGHLLAAQGVGIPVARFSIGFGPVLWSHRFRGVEYCVSLVPLGGYVMPAIEDEAEFSRISAARRILFWLGGPAANFACAAVFLAVVSTLANGFSLFGTLIQPWLETSKQTVQFVAALPAIFSHPDQLSGIVGIVAAGKSFVAGGLTATLKFAIFLNLNLAIFNLLPVAPLDGGKIFFCLLERVHPRLARWQTGISLAGLALLLLLMVYTTVLDVVRQWA